MTRRSEGQWALLALTVAVFGIVGVLAVGPPTVAGPPLPYGPHTCDNGTSTQTSTFFSARDA